MNFRVGDIVEYLGGRRYKVTHPYFKDPVDETRIYVGLTQIDDEKIYGNNDWPWGLSEPKNLKLIKRQNSQMLFPFMESKYEV